MVIQGKIEKLDLGTGGWGLVTSDGTKVLLLATNEKLSVFSHGQEVSIKGSKIETFGTMMWGDYAFEFTGLDQ